MMFRDETHIWGRGPAIRIVGPWLRLTAGRHVTDGNGWCWCQPRLEEVEPFGHVVVHRHFFDRSEYDE